MKDLICIGLLLQSLDRYDYKTAIAIIDSLTANVRRSYESGEGRQ